MKLATRVIIGAALVTVANAVDGCAGLAVPCGATCCSAGSFCEKVGTHTRCQTVSKTDHKLPSISLPTDLPVTSIAADVASQITAIYHPTATTDSISKPTDGSPSIPDLPTDISVPSVGANSTGGANITATSTQSAGVAPTNASSPASKQYSSFLGLSAMSIIAVGLTMIVSRGAG